MSDKAPRPLAKSAMGWFVRGGDGLFHVTPNERKRKAHKAYDLERPDMECCEHCPCEDCIRSGAVKPCLREITYGEYAAVREMLRRRVDGGERLGDIKRELGVSYNTLGRLIWDGGYPSPAVQRKMKEYYDKYIKENEDGIHGLQTDAARG